MPEAASKPVGLMSRIGELLLERAAISDSDLEKALSFQQEFGGRLGAILVRLGAVAEDMVLEALSDQLGLGVLPRSDIPEDPTVYLAAIDQTQTPRDWWFDQDVLIWPAADASINCLCRDPLATDIQETVERAVGNKVITWWLVRSRDLDYTLDMVRQTIARDGQDIAGDVALLRELAEEAPVVELVSNTMAQAVNEGASDIHVEPKEHEFEIRFRIDGVLQNRLTLPRSRFDAVASRVKLIAGLDIAERRLPQDGRIGIRISGKELDLRVSTLPGVYGESIVMRLLLKQQEDMSLDTIGLAKDHYEIFSQLVTEPYGIILVTGPTGSGKSTTLKGVLEHIIDGETKIITVEDPVEYNIPGITQVQTKSEIGLNFARALRSILRQDPDVIMIGEMRDLETAQIGVQASLTGHMVFSTLHTNDSLGAVTRLTDMGVEPFLVASSMRAVVAQRLVRRLCPSCRVPTSAPAAVTEKVEALRARFPDLFSAEPQWHQPQGCKACQHTGYRGRMGIYELALIDEGMQEKIAHEAGHAELRAHADKGGFRDLMEDGLIKAWHGQTSVDEVIRVAGQTDQT